MHAALIAIVALIIFSVVVHFIFKIVKFTIMVFLFGVALIAAAWACQTYLGINVVGMLAGHL